jgi:hypothetical protein
MNDSAALAALTAILSTPGTGVEAVIRDIVSHHAMPPCIAKVKGQLAS